MDETALQLAWDAKYAEIILFMSQNQNVSQWVNEFLSSLRENNKEFQLQRMTTFLESMRENSKPTTGHTHLSNNITITGRHQVLQVGSQHGQGTVLQILNPKNLQFEYNGAGALTTQSTPNTTFNMSARDPEPAQVQQGPKIRLQTPKPETLQKCTKFTKWAVDFLRQMPDRPWLI